MSDYKTGPLGRSAIDNFDISSTGSEAFEEEGKFEEGTEAAAPGEGTARTSVDDEGEDTETATDIWFSSDGLMRMASPSVGRKTPPPIHPSSDEQEEPARMNMNGSTTSIGDEDIKDIAKTGKWGKISSKELLSLSLVLAAVIGVAMFVVVAVVLRDGGSGASSVEPMPNSTSNTIASSVSLTSQQQLDILRELIGRNPITEGYLNFLPADEGALEDRSFDVTIAPIVRAASWLIHEDPVTSPEELVPRFALATIFYANGGEDWVNSTNWVSGKSVCDGWHGISCRLNSGQVERINLPGNGLIGRIPEVLTLLPEVRLLRLCENALTGEIPGNVFASMPKLTILYLKENQLEGQVPESLQDNGVLRKYILYGYCCCNWRLYYRFYSHNPFSLQALSFYRITCSLARGPRNFALHAQRAAIHSTSLDWIASASRVTRNAAVRPRIALSEREQLRETNSKGCRLV